MGLSEYLVTFYSIFVGFAASSYIVGWGNIIKNFDENKPYWGQLVWSMAFFSLMLNDWWVSYRYLSSMELHPINLLSMLFQPTLVYFISILIFPDKPTENHREHFEKHKRAILIVALFIIAKIYWGAKSTVAPFLTLPTHNLPRAKSAQEMVFG